MNKNIDNDYKGPDDINPERHFIDILTDPARDITEILGHQAIENIGKYDTSIHQNISVEIRHISTEIGENTRKLDRYLSFMGLVAAEDAINPSSLIQTTKNAYPGRLQNHEKMKNQVEFLYLDKNDKILFSRLQELHKQQISIIKAIEEELPKVRDIIKTNILEEDRYEEIYYKLLEKADVIKFKSILLSEFAESDKYALHHEDWSTFEQLQTNKQKIVDYANHIQDQIAFFLVKRPILSDKEVHTIYAKLRRLVNNYNMKTTEYDKLMIKYDE